MKKIFLILIFIPSLCFSQPEKEKSSGLAKPSTTACPTWNKKGKKSDKAAYFQYLRTPKTKVNRQTSSTDPQKTKLIEGVQKKENASQKTNIEQPAKQANLPIVKLSKEEGIESMPEKTEIISVAKEKAKKETVDTTKTAPTEGSTEDKNKTDNSKIKRKLKFLTRKTTKVHRHSNAKCPSF